MVRYIDADEFLSKFVNEFWSTAISFSSVDDIVEKLVKKAGDITPVVHAHWDNHMRKDFLYDHGQDYELVEDGYTCSNCNHYEDFETNYCSNCGAKMDESIKINYYVNFKNCGTKMKEETKDA